LINQAHHFQSERIVSGRNSLKHLHTNQHPKPGGGLEMEKWLILISSVVLTMAASVSRMPSFLLFESLNAES